MRCSLPSLLRGCAALLYLLPLLAWAQTLTINNDVQTVATLASTTATLTGKAELHVTGTGDPLSGSVINLNSTDAWLFLESIQPSTVISTFLSRVKVSGAAAVSASTVRVAPYGAAGAVVIPQGPNFTPMTLYSGKGFTGTALSLRLDVDYGTSALGALSAATRSFRLKRGYVATVAQQQDGSGISKVYVAQDGDLDVSVLPAALDNSIRFVRIWPWRWTAKKGIAGNLAGVQRRWYYDWNLDQNSTVDEEYVPIRAQQYWPTLTGQNWRTRGSSHLLGYNEPDQSGQANLTVAQAIAGWPDLLATGLRVGAPAVSDGGVSWLYSFISQANAANLRVDYVPVHYYRSYSNAANPDGATTQFYNFLKAIHDQVQRPLWVTEFNNGANWTTDPDPTAAQQQATVAKMIAMLDSTPWVERYALYNWVEDVRRLVWDDGSLTAAGVTYRDDVSPISYVQEVPDAGIAPDAFYPFEGDASDASGNGNDAIRVGAEAFPTNSGSAISFNGTSDYLLMPARLGDSTDFSFGAWVNWSGGANFQRIFDLGADTTHYLALTPKSDGSTLRFMLRNGGAEQQLNGPALTAGQWTHVAVTISGNTGKLFINGALVNTNTAMTINPVDVGTQLNYIGKSQFAADPLFKGRLDDARFYSTALTDAQVAAIAGSTAPKFTANPLAVTNVLKLRPFTGSLAGYVTGGSGALTFSKVSGPAWLAVAANGALTGVPGLTDLGVNSFVVRVTDAGGLTTPLDTITLQVTVADAPGMVARYAFDGTAAATAGVANGVTSGVPTYVTGHAGSAIDLNGTNAYVTLPAGVANYPEITLAAWVNWDGSSNWQRIFDFGNSTTEYLFLTPKSGGGTLRFGIMDDAAEQDLNGAALTIGQWTHVAITLGSNVGKLYVNGALADTQAITVKPSDFNPTLNYLGKSQFSDPLFNGRIDDFQIFNQALTAAQIAALVGGNAPAFTASPISKPAATAGQSYEQTLADGATDPDAGSTLTFSKVSGPQWLTVAANGRIFGVPSLADAGVNRFVVRATDGTLLASDAVLNIVVPGSSGLRAQYQFDGSTADSVGGTAGTAVGSPTYGFGLFDQAIKLNGTSSYVQLPSGFISGLSDITIAARVRWDGGANWQRVFDFGTDTSHYLFLTPKSAAGVPSFSITVGGYTSEQKLAASLPLPVGEWAHLAVTLIGNTGTLYVNGAPVDTETITLHPSTIAPTLNYLGKSQFAADPLFNGLIDDFRVYDHGLTAAEVSSLAVPVPAVSVADSSFTAWAAGIAFPSGQAGLLADPDGDGVTNAWEYLLGLNPLAASTAGLPQTQIMSDTALGLGSAGKTYLTLQARVRKMRLGVTLVPEAAASMSGLSAADAASHAHQAGAAVTDGAYEIFTYYYDVPIQDSPTGSGAIRLRAIMN